MSINSFGSQEFLENVLAQDVSLSRKLSLIVSDLRKTTPGPALKKLAILLLLILGSLWIVFGTESLWAFLFGSALFSTFYTSMMITTHDCSHRTFTGNKYFDEIFPRIISIMPFWPHGTYQEIHKLHHKMNGSDVRDPERTQWEEQEVKGTGRFTRFYLRHQLFIRAFVMGGVGMIIDMVKKGLVLSKRSTAVRKQMCIDAAMLIVGFGSLMAVAHHFGVLWKFLVLYLILERVTGAVMQVRNCVEHYGLWGKQENFFMTQLLNCRNLTVHPLVSWFFNGLNFHSVHHAYADIPFYNLEVAHNRVERLMREQSVPLPQSCGYWKTFSDLARYPVAISSQKSRDSYYPGKPTVEGLSAVVARYRYTGGNAHETLPTGVRLRLLLKVQTAHWLLICKRK